MGIIISRFRKKKSTSERLEDIDDRIKKIEKFQKETEQQFRRVIGKLVVSSILVYIGALVVYYYYFSPDTFRENILKFMPLLVFPVAILVTRKLLRWYYKRKLSKNETNLKRLKTDKKKILEEVMDTETYKVAKDILEKYAPEQLGTKDVQKIAPVRAILPPSRGEMVPRQRVPYNTDRKPNGAPVYPDVAFGAVPNSSSQPQPRLSLPRPILQKDRGAFDKLVDMLVGDGPSNRYALICRVCSSHNGMALKHEFEYLAYRCAYCMQWNPARKQKPHAPNLFSDTGSQDESDVHSELEMLDGERKAIKEATTAHEKSDHEPEPHEFESANETKLIPDEKEAQEESLIPDQATAEKDSFDVTDLSKAINEVSASVTNTSSTLPTESETAVPTETAVSTPEHLR